MRLRWPAVLPCRSSIGIGASTIDYVQPHLNAAYYGPPIPPQQPPHYGPAGPPPAAPGRRRLFMVAAAAVTVLGAASLVVWLIFRPRTITANADSAALSRFDLGSGGGGGGGGNLLQYNLTVGIRLRNPNRFGVRYDYADAQAFYGGDWFAFDPVPPFYLGSKSDGRVTATFSGSSVMAGDDVQRSYRRETTEGFYDVTVKVYADLSFKASVIDVHDYKSKVTCTLRFPVPAGGSANSTAMTPLGTRCDVDF
ncbi:hypothetical protein ACP70R_009948 [Stipagrostis hirtigluma subsp. patula]